jgi:hypothetical protein
MKLSAEQFAELASSFTSDSTEPRPERRGTARVELNASVKVIPLLQNQQLPAQTVIVSDFTSRGIAIQFPSPLQVGDQFIAEIPRKSGGVAQLLCSVAHCRPGNAHFHRVGAEFIRTLDSIN